MNNPIKEIYRFNEKAGLLDKGYDDTLESSFQIEEALEGFDITFLALLLNMHEDMMSPKDISRSIISKVSGELSDVDRLDKACDAVVFAVGSMAKLGLNPNQITKALNIVMQANFKKLGMSKDSEGKLMKPEGFEGPEPLLQKVLDERNS